MTTTPSTTITLELTADELKHIIDGLDALAYTYGNISEQARREKSWRSVKEYSGLAQEVEHIKQALHK